ncbi:phospholipase D family protein [Confluentibacter sediminis]|uniref:phospholipase D family protein n=1 Tax=Confluentibacter sediminis TaxID=2219045 RepID=UPI000DAE3896|nr:phospholipase D family protein [Confluentibacter sediminis]
MAKFLKGNELNAELEKLFESAQGNIILISPYIKLHDRYKSTLLTKLDRDDLEITVLFGKNEDDMSRSMKQEDFDFFKQFPNIEILFEKRLHAKYYANETKAILSSMNLYGFSQNNNIETGILMEKTLRGTFTGENNLENDSWEYFETVLQQAELLFEKKPVYEKKNILSSKKYIKSEIETDKLSDFFNNKSYNKIFKKNTQKKESKTTDNIKNEIGYCIRTGKEIAFNIEKPMEYEAFKMWNKYKDPDFPEKYCHFSGELSNGKTSVNKPILNENWKKAKEKFNL